MKLTLQGLTNRKEWLQAGFRLPGFDYPVVWERTGKAPCWIHFGCGNIFRAFQARIVQELLNKGVMDRGITVTSGTNPAAIRQSFAPYDNLSILVTLGGDGTLTKTVVGSIMEALPALGGSPKEQARLREIFSSPSLQMASFTITEKGYALRDAPGRFFPEVEQDLQTGPRHCRSYLGQVASLLYTRYQNGRYPLAMVSMDNCSHNGDILKQSLLTIAESWEKKRMVSEGFTGWLEDPSCVSFPWTMIDKITPRPDETIRRMLAEDGVEDLTIRSNVTGSVAAPFVNAEACEYLVIEDAFPAGRPPLEEGGVLFTSRETVEKAERMKVCTCLNPLHTALAIFGCLLGYNRMSGEMKDPDLVRLALSVGYQEGLPVVTHPGVLNPEQFLREVVTLRIPNPYLPDTPQRIATDTSQKLPVRFGETLKAYLARPDLSVRDLVWIPLVYAGWLRYLLAVDDAGNSFSPSPDPRLAQLSDIMKDFHLGIRPDTEEICRKLAPIFSDITLWGVDLIACGLSWKVAENFGRMLAGPGAVRELLREMRKLPADGIPEDLRQNFSENGK